MSGPKTSEYVLTPEQQKRLEEERQRQLKIAEEKATLNRIRDNLNSLCEGFSREEARANELLKRTSGDNGFFNLLKSFNTNITNAINVINKVRGNITLEQIEAAHREVNSIYSEIKKIQKALYEIDFVNTQQLNANINADVDKGFNLNFEISKPKTITKKQVTVQESNIKRRDITELKSKILSSLAELRCLEGLTDKLKSEISRVYDLCDSITDADYLSNYNAVGVTELIKNCKDCSVISGDFYTYSARYVSLCNATGKIPEKIECSSEGLALLKRLIDNIEKEVKSADEQEYISKCVDEVMEEMGYNLIGTRAVVKKSGVKFHNELYTFSEGTAVNVTYAADGKITMELGGVDTEDRFPSDDEAERLCEDMQTFCGKYSEFERRLKEKGVVLNHISLSPPDAEYAQIINTSDYEMRQTVETIQANTIRNANENHRMVNNNE